MNKGENAYQKVCIQYFTTPCGQLILASIGDELCLCDWYGMPCAVRNKHKIGRELPAEALRWYDEASGCWRVEKGDYEAQLGTSSRDLFASIPFAVK